MKQIFSSATKIVFILTAVATIAALFTGKITGEQFLVISTMVFAFYYGNKKQDTTN